MFLPCVVSYTKLRGRQTHLVSSILLYINHTISYCLSIQQSFLFRTCLAILLVIRKITHTVRTAKLSLAESLVGNVGNVNGTCSVLLCCGNTLPGPQQTGLDLRGAWETQLRAFSRQSFSQSRHILQGLFPTHAELVCETRRLYPSTCPSVHPPTPPIIHLVPSKGQGPC